MILTATPIQREGLWVCGNASVSKRIGEGVADLLDVVCGFDAIRDDLVMVG